MIINLKFTPQWRLVADIMQPIVQGFLDQMPGPLRDQGLVSLKVTKLPVKEIFLLTLTKQIRYIIGKCGIALQNVFTIFQAEFGGIKLVLFTGELFNLWWPSLPKFPPERVRVRLEMCMYTVDDKRGRDY